MSFSETIIKILSVVFVIIILFVCAMFSFEFFLVQRDKRQFEEYISQPIYDDTLEDFCNRNLIPEHIANCDDPDLVIEKRQIQGIIVASLPEDPTYGDFERLFSEYQGYCARDPELGNVDMFNCDYGFGGYTLRAFFDKETEEVLEISWLSPGS